MDNVRNAARRNQWHARCRGGTRWIVLRNHTSAARLARDHASGGVSVTGEARCAGGGLCTCAIRTAIDIGDLDAAKLINAGADEIEKVTANIGTAFTPDTA